MATFIDISSAFDKLNPVKATEALLNKGVDKVIVSWYRDYLLERYAHIQIKGIYETRRLSTGCPQGGVLSTLLWNIAFDDLLNLFKHHNMKCIGYADDGSLITAGKHMKLLIRLHLNIWA